MMYLTTEPDFGMTRSSAHRDWGRGNWEDPAHFTHWGSASFVCEEFLISKDQKPNSTVGRLHRKGRTNFFKHVERCGNTDHSRANCHSPRRRGPEALAASCVGERGGRGALARAAPPTGLRSGTASVGNGFVQCSLKPLHPTIPVQGIYPRHTHKWYMYTRIFIFSQVVVPF